MLKNKKIVPPVCTFCTFGISTITYYSLVSSENLTEFLENIVIVILELHKNIQKSFHEGKEAIKNIQVKNKS